MSGGAVAGESRRQSVNQTAKHVGHPSIHPSICSHFQPSTCPQTPSMHFSIDSANCLAFYVTSQSVTQLAILQTSRHPLIQPYHRTIQSTIYSTSHLYSEFSNCSTTQSAGHLVLCISSIPWFLPGRTLFRDECVSTGY